MRFIYSLIMIALWITGIVLAKGFWWTFAAIFIPPVGWYFVAETLLKSFGLI